MFTNGFEKTSSHILKIPKPRTNPITVQDALGASKAKPWSKPLSHFASGHHPKAGLKSMSQVRRVT